MRLSYDVAADCPDAAAYAGHVESRSSRLRVDPAHAAADATDTALVEVRLAQEDGRWVGHVRVEGAEVRERRVEGARCSDVVAALALITVIQLDASSAAALEAGAAPVSANSEASAPSRVRAGEAPASQRETPRAATSEAQAASTEPALGVVARAGEAPAPIEPSVDGAGAAVAARLVAYVGYASAPSHAFKAALGADITWGSAASRWATPLSIAYTRGNEVNAAGNSALTLLTAQLAVCPPLPNVADWFWLRACAGLRAGALVRAPSRGEPPIQTFQKIRPWIGAGPRLELGVPLSPAWSLRALTDLAFHFVRDEFVLKSPGSTPDTPELTTLYQPELFSLELAVGLAYGF